MKAALWGLGKLALWGVLALIAYVIFAEASSDTKFWIGVLIVVLGIGYEIQTIKDKSTPYRAGVLFVAISRKMAPRWHANTRTRDMAGLDARVRHNEQWEM